MAAGLTLVQPAPTRFVDETKTPYSIYQKNLFFLLPDTAPVVADILEYQPDFVTLQELHQRNRPILSELRKAYPHQHFCPFAAVGGIAVLSRWPLVDGKTLCEQGSGLAAAQVETPDGRLWIVALHLHWPYPYRQPEHVRSILTLLTELDGPAVVGGDFNMVSWSWAVRAIARETRTSYAGYPGGTFRFSYHSNGRNLASWMPPIPIDHVLIPRGAMPISVSKRDRLGSDHYGVVAEFALPK